MGKSKGGRETKLMSASSPMKTSTTLTTTMSTKHVAPAEASYPPGRRAHRPARPRDVYPPNPVPPSVHAILASTTIPRPKSMRAGARERGGSHLELRRSREKKNEGLTLDAVLDRTQDPEKELSLSLCKGPLDVLLSAPEDLDDDGDTSTSFSGSFLSSASTQAVSVGSMPSLAACSTSPHCASLTDDTSVTSPPSFRRKRASSMFVSRRFELVSPSQDGGEAHPLSAEVNVGEPDCRVSQPPEEAASRWDAFSSLPLRSAFKSNLTASLRVLRSAAKSFSSMSLARSPPRRFAGI
ncbi:hypothetical protein VUR80DRAFT_199 [Thermomyces stellatus]